jgi:hypothetical protein
VDVVRRTDLQRLALGRQGPCVSVLLPTHRAGRGGAGPDQAKEPAAAGDSRAQDRRRQGTRDRPPVGAAAKAARDRLFWQFQSDGLAPRYDRRAGTGLTSQDPQDIGRAAEDGRIETLFVSHHPAGPSGAGGDVPVSDGDGELRDVLELATVTALPKAAPSTCSRSVRSRAAATPQRCSGTRLRPMKPFRPLPVVSWGDGGGGAPVAGQPAGWKQA